MVRNFHKACLGLSPPPFSPVTFCPLPNTLYILSIFYYYFFALLKNEKKVEKPNRRLAAQPFSKQSSALQKYK
jgi:hypothetical protein